MIKFNFDNYCCGCGACYNICPTHAIQMISNSEGFLVPKIDNDICINCGKCDSVCPHLNSEKIKGDENDIFAVWMYSSQDDSAKLKSSSGAACFELGKAILNSKGYVVGCIWDSALTAYHEIGEDENFLTKTQGSKYVQSDTNDVYKKVISKLRKGERVLFTGTPCQATAMHNICIQSAIEYRDSLIILAIMCHGVASPMVWESYKKYSENKVGSPLVFVNFRDKSREGYKKSYCYFQYANGYSEYMPTYLPTSKYIEATLVYNLAMRNSCSHCDCKGVNIGIDLIVGDWYAEYKGEGKLGTNCLIAFTERGKKFALDSLKNLKRFDYVSAVKENTIIEKSIDNSPNRNLFLKRIKVCDYWNKVEELYPRKYRYKKILIKLDLYDILKKIVRKLF